MIIDLSNIDPNHPNYEPTIVNFNGGEAIVSFNSPDWGGKVDLDVSFDPNIAEDSWIHVKCIDEYTEIKDVTTQRYHLIKLRNCKLRFTVKQPGTEGKTVQAILS